MRQQQTTARQHSSYTHAERQERGVGLSHLAACAAAASSFSAASLASSAAVALLPPLPKRTGVAARESQEDRWGGGASAAPQRRLWGMRCCHLSQTSSESCTHSWQARHAGRAIWWHALASVRRWIASAASGVAKTKSTARPFPGSARKTWKDESDANTCLCSERTGTSEQERSRAAASHSGSCGASHSTASRDAACLCGWG